MKVAIPLFGDEVSPRFGCSAKLLMADVENGRVLSQSPLDVSEMGGCGLAGFLNDSRVEVVICGGIHQRHRDELESGGLRVIWGVIGRASEALEAFAAGNLKPDQFIRAGGRRRRGQSWQCAGRGGRQGGAAGGRRRGGGSAGSRERGGNDT